MATLPKPVQREYASAKRQKIQNNSMTTTPSTSTTTTQSSQKNDYRYEMMTGRNCLFLFNLFNETC